MENIQIERQNNGIVRILNAICKGEFYIVYENEHYKNEDYIVNYEELKENNKMIIKKYISIFD